MRAPFCRYFKKTTRIDVLDEVKALVESVPKALKEGVDKIEVEKIKKQIEEAGGTVELK